MSIIDDLVGRVTSLEQRLDALSDTEIVPFNIGCSVENSAAISIPNNSVTALTFDTELFDTDTMHSTTTNTGRITMTTAGKYLVVGYARMDPASGGRRQMRISKGGTAIATFEYSSVADATGVPNMVISTIHNFSATDYVELSVFQNSGSGVNVTSSAGFRPTFSAFRLA